MGEWRGGLFVELQAQAAAAGINKAAERLRALSLAAAPIDIGTLRGSAQVEPADSGHLVAEVSYDTPYAVIQHEALSFRHTVGGAKYLEGPLRENGQELTAIIAAEMGSVDG